jgi:phosphoribosyl-ATP pyrophosphohydrolase
MPSKHMASFTTLVSKAISEGERAMVKFPQPNYVITKVAEEAGEVVKAAVHSAEGREPLTSVRDEMVQTIAMLYRLWCEGDEVHGLPPVANVGPI